MATGDTTNNKISLSAPFAGTVATACGTYQYIYKISTQKGTFVQDTVLTTLNTAVLVANTIPAKIEIPVTGPGFYTFSLQIEIKSLPSMTVLKTMLTDWQINVNVGVAYILP